MQKKIEILDVRFDNVTSKEALEQIFEWLNKGKKGYLCTPNPEMLLEAETNIEFRNILNNSILNIADGIGILWAATHLSKKSPKWKTWLTLPLIAISPNSFKKVLRQRVTGTDLMQQIAAKAAKTNHTMFLLGAGPKVAEITKEILQKRYPGLKITGTYSGSPFACEEQEIIQRINNTAPDILFVAYGAPAQEMWISRNLKHLNSIKIAIGVGGAFDFISGKRKRAPGWMRKTGLEWLFRLIQEPSRWKRIYNATVKFPVRVIKRLK